MNSAIPSLPTVTKNRSLANPPSDDEDVDVYLKRSQRRILQNLIHTTNQKGISIKWSQEEYKYMSRKR